MAGAASILASRIRGLRCLLAPGPSVSGMLVEAILGPEGRGLFENVTAKGSATPAAAALAGAHAAVVHAGTATLEAALMGVPCVVVAKVSRPSFEIARRLVQVRHVAMPSIVLGRRVFTERIQDEVEPLGIARDVGELLEDESEPDRMAGISSDLRSCLSVPEGPVLFARLVSCADGV
jgi:lipid-A-disaccharide synthase